jgi:hypothetical protein
MRDGPLHYQQQQHCSKTNYGNAVSPTQYHFFGGNGAFAEPVMEIDEDEEKSSQHGEDEHDPFPGSKDFDKLRKRRYLKEYQLPSGLSVELPPEPSSKYRLSSV